MKKPTFCFLFIHCLVLWMTNICAASSKRAIVVGATSGMGRAVAKLLAQNGYIVGLVGRRVHLLESLQNEIKTTCFIKKIDVSHHKKAAQTLKDLISYMGGLDLMLISISAFSDIEHEQDMWIREKKTIDVDLVGFWVCAHVAVQHFEHQKSGHLVGISSIAGLIGSGINPVYSGAKAFISTYLQGIRNRMIHNNIPVDVTDIMPGWVDVEDASFSDLPGTYWVASVDKAAQQIFEAIQNKEKVAYITRRWKLIAMLLKENPENMFEGFYDFQSLANLILDI